MKRIRITSIKVGDCLGSLKDDEKWFYIVTEKKLLGLRRYEFIGKIYGSTIYKDGDTTIIPDTKKGKQKMIRKYSKDEADLLQLQQ